MCVCARGGYVCGKCVGGDLLHGGGEALEDDVDARRVVFVTLLALAVTDLSSDEAAQMWGRSVRREVEREKGGDGSAESTPHSSPTHKSTRDVKTQLAGVCPGACTCA